MPSADTQPRWLYALPLLFLLLYIGLLGERPLFMPDETRYAEIPREMLASGDWAVPHLNGLRYFEKPPLGYWMTAISLGLFGENAIAARLPAALSAGFSALLLFWLLLRQGQGVRLAWLGAAIFLSSLLVFMLGVYNALDSQLNLWLSAALVMFFFAYQAPWALWRHGYLALFGLFCGLAFLTKGFLAFAVPVVVIVPFLLWEKRWRALLTWFWLPMAVAALVSLPWGLLVHAREADFWHYFFWIEHIKRFAAEDAQHAEPVWFYVPVLLLGALPWIFSWPAAVAGLKRLDWQQSLLRFALLWLLMPLLFFSAAKGKLPTYILPCLLPLSLLTALGLQSYLATHTQRQRLLNTGLWVGIGLFLLLALSFLGQPVVQINQPLYQREESGHWLFAVAAFASVALFLWWATRTRSFAQFGFIAAAPLLLFAALQTSLPQQTLDRKASAGFLRACAEQIPHDAILVSDANLIHAVGWYYRRDDVYLLEQGELAYGLSYPDAQGRLLDADGLAKLVIAANKAQRAIAVVYKDRPDLPYLQIAAELGFQAQRSGRFVLLLWK